jgi:dihydroflavonol-4-reductase
MEPRHSYWNGLPVCVTGGTGFLGYRVVKQLLDLGAGVIVLALPPRAGHPRLRESRAACVFGDVREPEVVRRATAGCRVVFHTAGVVAGWGPALEQMHSVHVVGTRQVLNTVCPATRVVHTSSIVTVGASRSGEVPTEDSRFNLEHWGRLHPRQARGRAACP